MFHLELEKNQHQKSAELPHFRFQLQGRSVHWDWLEKWFPVPLGRKA